MSAITDLVDRIHEIITTDYPAKLELTNDRDIEENDEISLADGFYIKYLSSTSDDDLPSDGILSLHTGIEIGLTKQLYEGNCPSSIRRDSKKNLFNERLVIVKKIQEDPQIRNLIEAFDFVSDGGIEYVFPEKINYISLSSIFSTKYVEFVDSF